MFFLLLCTTTERTQPPPPSLCKVSAEVGETGGSARAASQLRKASRFSHPQKLVLLE